MSSGAPVRGEEAGRWNEDRPGEEGPGWGSSSPAGGLRLSSAVNTYQATADPAVSGPARRMLSSAVAGDLEASGDAAQEASAACARRGTSVRLPGGVQCVTTPCP